MKATTTSKPARGGARAGAGRKPTTVTLRLNEHVTASSGIPGEPDWESKVYKVTAITTGKAGERVFCLTPASPYTGTPLIVTAAPLE